MKQVIKVYLTIFFCISTLGLLAQTDTLTGTANEVIVTGTRTEKKLGNVAVPVTIISKKNIQQAGSLRLTDILQEQAGLFITANFGAGVQMQGLNPDYTMIMINGEPLVGRTSGILDLSRITVGNIKKIEIVKGPSSSLYGSEAMAGVINIITDNSGANQLSSTLRYGTYNTLDASVQGATTIKKVSLNAFSNYYGTNGFSIRPFSVERTVAPISRLTNQLQVGIPFNHKMRLDVNTRYTYEKIENDIAVTNNGTITYSKGKEIHKDFNLNPVFTHQVNEKLKYYVRVYATRFIAEQSLNTTASSFYNDRLDHQFIRFENQTDYSFNKKLTLTTGAGYVIEGVKSNRYADESVRRTNHITYAFTQLDAQINNHLTVITGLRYDNNSLFAGALSPKIAFMYKPFQNLKITASVGAGFKAPDFRQLYLNFTNTAAGGYTVFGSLEAQDQINRLSSLGQIQSVEPDFYKLKDLKPETSTGINIGASYNFNNKANISFNAFRNDINNLIDTRLVAYYNSGAQIFSYLNVDRAYTQGFETDVQYKITKHLTIASGYQFLLTADKSDIEKINNQKVYTKDANGFARLLNRNEYIGLPNRSKHMANVKLLYEKNNFFINLRTLYRSKWAVADRDGNGLYNTNDEFANGYAQINIAIGKTLNNGFKVMIGSDNITNYTDVNNLPNLPGRTFYTSISYNFLHKKTSKQ